MNVRQLEIFHAIMEAGSVTGAAKVLSVSQPAVSIALRHAEDQLQFKLFERKGGRLRATDEAHMLYRETAKIFDSVDCLRQTISDIRLSRTGFLTIGCIPMLGGIVLPRIIASFAQAYPGVRVNLQVRPQREIVDLVSRERVDLAFGMLASPNPAITAAVVGQSRIIAIAPQTSELANRRVMTPSDIAQAPYIGFRAEQGMARIINGTLIQARVRKDPIIEVDTMFNAWSMVQLGMGVALVDDYSSYQTLFTDVAIIPFEPVTTFAIDMLEPAQKRRSQVTQSFLDHVLITNASGKMRLRDVQISPGYKFNLLPNPI